MLFFSTDKENLNAYQKILWIFKRKFETKSAQKIAKKLKY